MVFNKKSFLKNEIVKLKNAGFISTEQEEAIAKAYHFDDNPLSLLSILAFVFIGLSLLTLIAYNWQEIPPIFKTSLLLITLLGTHLAMFYYYQHNAIYTQCFGVLSGFALLANFALLSQIYHLGEDTALAFLSGGIAMLLLASALKSFVIFLNAYVYASIWFFWRFLIEESFSSAFILFIALGFVVQAFLSSFLSDSHSTKSPIILAFFNITLLGVYVYSAPFHSIDRCSCLMWLGLLLFPLKSYQTFASIALIIAFLEPSIGFDSFRILFKGVLLNGQWQEILWHFIIFWLLIAILGIIHLRKKHYFLSLFVLIYLLHIPLILFSNQSFEAHFALLQKGFFSFVVLLFGIYLMRENDKTLGILSLFALAIVRYIDLLGDYISASVLFLCFGLLLLVFSKLKKRH